MIPRIYIQNFFKTVPMFSYDKILSGTREIFSNIMPGLIYPKLWKGLEWHSIIRSKVCGAGCERKFLGLKVKVGQADDAGVGLRGAKSLT
jgi:hypothetical protein